MAEVYWIRLPEHTDVFTQGYVGITIKTAEVRFNGHVHFSKNSGNSSLIGNVIRKYGRENLVLETLVICSPEYSVWLENILRPDKGIGWNMAAGGEYPAKNRVISELAKENMRKAQLGRKHPEEVKKKIGEANSRRVWTEESRAKASKSKIGHKKSPETLLKMSLASTGRSQSEESIEKTKVGKFYFYLKKNRSVYSRAQELYDHYVSGLTYSKTENLLGFKRGSLQRIFDYFNKGWNPSEDSIWKEEYLIQNKESINGS